MKKTGGGSTGRETRMHSCLPQANTNNVLSYYYYYNWLLSQVSLRNDNCDRRKRKYSDENITEQREMAGLKRLSQLATLVALKPRPVETG